MKIQLSDHFTYQKIFRFVLPSIVMMVFTSIYGVVDGFFISNFAGKTAFASINLVMPFIMIVAGIGFMIGTGGTALVSKYLGQKEEKRANECFTMMVIVVIVSGIIVSLLGIIFMRKISYFLGATEAMIEDCVVYGRIVIAFNMPYMLQNVFQSFMIAAEKPKLGLEITVLSGVTNMVLDALFVGVFKWGVAGAAFATGASQCVGGFGPLIYFAKENDSRLRLVKTKLELEPILQAAGNGSSELMSNISSSLVGAVYNYQLMKYIGENGVSAYGVLMYVQFIFVAIYVGYAIGCAPIVSYHYGAKNHAEVKNMLHKSITLMSVLGIILALAAFSLSSILAKIFVGYDIELLALTTHAFKLFSLSFLFAGLNIYTSSFFTALNNGVISAAVSFIRTLIFQMAFVLFLPMILGTDGIWVSSIAAEVAAFIVSTIFLVIERKEYQY